MKGKFDAYVLWPLAKKFQNWIVDRSTAFDFTVYNKNSSQNIRLIHLKGVFIIIELIRYCLCFGWYNFLICISQHFLKNKILFIVKDQKERLKMAIFIEWVFWNKKLFQYLSAASNCQNLEVVSLSFLVLFRNIISVVFRKLLF